ncbi:MAG: rhodanese-like domain-containing protein [Salinivirgaceae bacterium]
MESEDIFSSKGNIINNLRHLSATEAYECCKLGAILIDVREEFMSHIKTFDVPEILIYPLRTFNEDITHLPKDRYLIFVDATGIKSRPAMEFANERGFLTIANLAGGLVEWERDGLPTLTYQKLIVSGKNKCQFVHKDEVNRNETLL